MQDMDKLPVILRSRPVLSLSSGGSSHGDSFPGEPAKNRAVPSGSAPLRPFRLAAPGSETIGRGSVSGEADWGEKKRTAVPRNGRNKPHCLLKGAGLTCG